jgi:hypothetical protein
MPGVNDRTPEEASSVLRSPFFNLMMRTSASAAPLCWASSRSGPRRRSARFWRRSPKARQNLFTCLYPKASTLRGACHQGTKIAQLGNVRGPALDACRNKIRPHQMCLEPIGPLPNLII